MAKDKIISEVNRLKKLMHLNEEFVSDVDDDFVEDPYTNILFIARDNNDSKYHYLVLFVKLDPTDNQRVYHYAYGFTVHDKNWNVIGKPIFTRNGASKYLPNDLRGKIVPLVLKMTRNLVQRINPPTIIRETMEVLEGDSLKRYDKITDLLVNDLGYEIKESGVSSKGINYWIMVKPNGEEITVDESYELDDLEKRTVRMNESVISTLTPELIKKVVELHYRNKEIKKNIL